MGLHVCKQSWKIARRPWRRIAPAMAIGEGREASKPLQRKALKKALKKGEKNAQRKSEESREKKSRLQTRRKEAERGEIAAEGIDSGEALIFTSAFPSG
mgnify:CR=1 FL=1